MFGNSMNFIGLHPNTFSRSRRLAYIDLGSIDSKTFIEKSQLDLRKIYGELAFYREVKGSKNAVEIRSY